MNICPRINAILIMVVYSLLISCTTTEPLKILKSQQESGTKSLLQAISILDKNSVWVSGHDATYGYTSDGGDTWQMFSISEADSLQFRDIQALSSSEVILMAAGPGSLSQIRKTQDSGKTWDIKYVMQDSLGFLDCIAFWDDKIGLAYGDQIAGELFILKTIDGGETWERIAPSILPPALGTEGGFAASGTCVEVLGDGFAWIGTGAGEKPRILYTKDYGQSWSSIETPIVSGEASGITSVNFLDDQNGFIVGGDLLHADQYTKNIAYTSDGGTSWKASDLNPVTKGAFYGADAKTINANLLYMMCGPNGIDYRFGDNTEWTQLDSANYWAVELHPSGTGWAVGKHGNILKITVN